MGIKATAMATETAAAFGISRTQAFDMILAVAMDLGISGIKFTEKEASEVDVIVARELKAGNILTLTRVAV